MNEGAVVAGAAAVATAGGGGADDGSESVWFLCKICRRIFPRKKLLIRHKRQVHGFETKLSTANKNGEANRDSSTSSSTMDKKMAVKRRTTKEGDHDTILGDNLKKAVSSFRTLIGRQLDDGEGEEEVAEHLTKISSTPSTKLVTHSHQRNELNVIEKCDRKRRSPPNKFELPTERLMIPAQEDKKEEEETESKILVKKRKEKEEKDEFLIPTAILHKITVYNSPASALAAAAAQTQIQTRNHQKTKNCKNTTFAGGGQGSTAAVSVSALAAGPVTNMPGTRNDVRRRCVHRSKDGDEEPLSKNAKKREKSIENDDNNNEKLCKKISPSFSSASPSNSENCTKKVTPPRPPSSPDKVSKSKRVMSKLDENRCKFCAKKLSCPRTLYDHLRLHTGETPFGCEDCEQKFSTPSQLSRHRWRCRKKKKNCGKNVNPGRSNGSPNLAAKSCLKNSHPAAAAATRAKISPAADDDDAAKISSVKMTPGKGKWRCCVCFKEFSTLSKSAVHNCLEQLRSEKNRKKSVSMATRNRNDHRRKQENFKKMEHQNHKNKKDIENGYHDDDGESGLKLAARKSEIETTDFQKFLVPQTFNGKSVFVCSFCMKVFSYNSIAISHVRSHVKNGDQLMMAPNLNDDDADVEADKFAGMPVLQKEVDDDDDLVPHEEKMTQQNEELRLKNLSKNNKIHQKHQHRPGQNGDKMTGQNFSKNFQQRSCQKQKQARERHSQKNQDKKEAPSVKLEKNEDEDFMNHVTTKLRGNSTCSYVCNFCGKNLRYPSHVKRHIPLHTGERKCECSMAGCSKTFSTVYGQWRHEREEHNFPNLNPRRQPQSPQQQGVTTTSQNTERRRNGLRQPACQIQRPQGRREDSTNSVVKGAEIDTNFKKPPPKVTNFEPMDFSNAEKDEVHETDENFEDDLDLHRKTPSPVDPDPEAADPQLTVKRRRVKVKGISKVEAWLAKEAENLVRQEERRGVVTADFLAAAAEKPALKNPPPSSPPPPPVDQSISSPFITSELHGLDKILYRCTLCKEFFYERQLAEKHVTAVHLDLDNPQTPVMCMKSGREKNEKIDTPGPMSTAAKIEQKRWSMESTESRYCLCNQVAYGKMVACDFQDCPIEWFHFQCVGLVATPPGKWFCPQCACADNDDLDYDE